MGKSILELFKTAKLEELNTTPGVPFTGKGTTVEEKYQVRDSKDIKVSSNNAFMTLPFYAYNKLRTIPKERKSESFLEEEFFGLRTLRGIASPIIYGTDIIRLKLQSTPSVEKMKHSANGGQGDGLTKFGQQIKDTRDQVNKFLGIPVNLIPSQYYQKFNNTNNETVNVDLRGVTPTGQATSRNENNINHVYNRMELTAKIRKDGAGTLLGKIMKQSGGDPSTVGRQVLGAGLSEAKKELRKKVLGTQQQSYNGFNDFRRTREENAIVKDPIILFSQITPYGEYIKDGDKLFSSDEKKYQGKFILRDRLEFRYQNQFIDTIYKPNYLLNENPVTNLIKNNNFFTTKYSPPQLQNGALDYNASYTSNPNPESSQNRFNGPSKELDENRRSNITLNEAIAKNETSLTYGIAESLKRINLDDLRPSYLKNKKKEDNKIGYSKTVNAENEAFVQNENVKSLNSNPNKQSLEKRRGIGSHFDILNQTGRFTPEELKGDKNGKYGDIPLNELDLIPIRFQKVNDGSAVYMRATITNFQESIKPNWETSNFVGNPFKFYTYTGVERTISFDLTAYATSQLELIMMWRRLDFLGKLAYPAQYTEAGVEPTVFYFTLGNIYVDRLGIVTSINYSLDDDKSIWEIGGDDAEGKFRARNSDKFSNVNTSWNGTFSIGNEQLGWENDSEEIWSKVKRDGIENNGYGYAVLENSEAKEENSKNKVVYLTMNNTRVNMNKYKLPHFLKASFEITLLESKNSTSKLYDYGKTITRSAI